MVPPVELPLVVCLAGTLEAVAGPEVPVDRQVDLWWLLASIREIYDMEANRRKATWFNMQKLVVNDYALGILVLKVTTTPQGSYFDRITESHRDRPTTQ
jgi:hypothetical protein